MDKVRSIYVPVVELMTAFRIQSHSPVPMHPVSHTVFFKLRVDCLQCPFPGVLRMGWGLACLCGASFSTCCLLDSPPSSSHCRCNTVINICVGLDLQSVWWSWFYPVQVAPIWGPYRDPDFGAKKMSPHIVGTNFWPLFRGRMVAPILGSRVK